MIAPSDFVCESYAHLKFVVNNKKIFVGGTKGAMWHSHMLPHGIPISCRF